MASLTFLGRSGMRLGRNNTITRSQMNLCWGKNFKNFTTLVGKGEEKKGGEMKEIGVLGGGVSGLATAYFLRKMLGEGAKITVLEGSSRVGGWIDTEEVSLPSSSSTFLLEKGPRSLRIQGKEMMELVDELGLGGEILDADKASLANRLIYHNNELILLPVGVGAMLKNPFFRKNVIPPALLEVFRPQKFREGKKIDGVEDESVGDFMERRFGKGVANVLIGALTPGIYSTNARALSVRSCFPSLFNLEKEYGSVVGGMVGGLVDRLLGKKKEGKEEKMEKERLKKEKEGRVTSGVYSFQRGMETVVDSLSSSLSQSPNVSLLLSSPVRKLEVGGNGRVGVVFGGEEKGEEGEKMEFDHVFSALPLNALAEVLPPSELGQEIKKVKYTNTAVINMVFEDKQKIVEKYKGFGYLCAPSSSEKILGVAFDSCTFPAHDNLGQQQQQQQQSPFTRISVMMGGDPTLPNYLNLHPPPTPSSPPSPSSPSSSDLLDIAQTHLRKHLSMEEDPLLVRVKKCFYSIPIYHVGYYETIENIGKLLRGKGEKGGEGVNLSIVGMGVNGVGVNDCVATARRTVEAFVEQEKK